MSVRPIVYQIFLTHREFNFISFYKNFQLNDSLEIMNWFSYQIFTGSEIIKEHSSSILKLFFTSKQTL